MGKARSSQPLMPSPDLKFIESRGVECLQAEKQRLPEAHSYRSSWRHHFENAIRFYRLGGDLKGLRELQNLTAPTAKLSKKLSETLITMENTLANQRRASLPPAKMPPASASA